MKESYINRINKLGKYAGMVVNVLKGLAIALMVAVVILYLFIDSVGKCVVYFYPGENIELTLDAREFGFIYSEKDRAEQEQYKKHKWHTYNEEAKYLGEAGAKTGKLELCSIMKEEYISNDTVKTSIRMKDGDVFLIVTLVYLVFIFVSLVYAGRFFKALKNEPSPFGKYVIKNMQRFAYSLLPWSVFGPAVYTNCIDKVSKISIFMGVNFVTIFVIIVLLCLAYIFKYGAMLQQESDETL